MFLKLFLNIWLIMKKKSNTANMQIPESLLKVAVEQTDDVKGNFQIGLGSDFTVADEPVNEPFFAVP